MRVILDFQACQSLSRFRGIGRGSYSLMIEMGRQLLDGGHEVICLLNSSLVKDAQVLANNISICLPKASIFEFKIPSQVAPQFPENAWRQIAARLLREHAIACLEPDFVHVPALLADGWADDSIASIGLLGCHIPTSLTQHDLIPLALSDAYLSCDIFRNYYFNKLDYVRSADLLLAISNYSKREAVDLLGISESLVVNISSAADPFFSQQINDFSSCVDDILSMGIRDEYFLYAPGGFDYRKNVNRLIEAYAILPDHVRAQHQLVIASNIGHEDLNFLLKKVESFGLSFSDVIFTEYVPDFILRALYSKCFVYVFPSLHEGFGLPALEAMCCGAAVVASNCTSIPEVIAMKDALFDPTDLISISNKLLQVHEDELFRRRLIAHSKTRSRDFSWENTARVAVEAISERLSKLMFNGWSRTPRTSLPSFNNLLNKSMLLEVAVKPSKADLDIFRNCYELNKELSEYLL